MNETTNDGSPRVLIAFATKYGQTAKIADFLAGRLHARGLHVAVKRCEDLHAGSNIADFDAILVGGSVIMEGLHHAARRFVAEHVDELNVRTSGFFQVSGAAGSRHESEQEAARTIMNRFLDKSGWSPTERASFAGAIPYTKYPFLLKWVMKYISWRNGGSTDTSRDHEYTDWDEVARFADSMAAHVLEAAPMGSTA